MQTIFVGVFFRCLFNHMIVQLSLLKVFTFLDAEENLKALYAVRLNINKKIILLLITLHQCFGLVLWDCILILYFYFLTI